MDNSDGDMNNGEVEVARGIGCYDYPEIAHTVELTDVSPSTRRTMVVEGRKRHGELDGTEMGSRSKKKYRRGYADGYRDGSRTGCQDSQPGAEEAQSSIDPEWADEPECAVDVPEETPEEAKSLSSSKPSDSPETPSSDAVAVTAEQVVQWLTGKSPENVTDVTQLKGLLKLYKAVRGAANSNAMKHFIMTNAVVAVDRVNELRERHPHCQGKPLTQSYHLCLRAAQHANLLATSEELDGLTADLAEEICRNAMNLCLSPVKGGVTLSMGLAACRFETSSSTRLPLQSVKFWYAKGKSYPYGDMHAAMSDNNYAQFAQLLDSDSRYMGWAGAMADSGAMYAVALFDHVWSSDGSSFSSLQPPTVDAGSGKKAAAAVPFSYSAPPATSMHQLIRRLTGVFRMFTDKDLAEAEPEQAVAAALSLCNLATQRAHETIVHLRRLHRSMQELVLSQRLCNFAAAKANEMAVVDNLGFSDEQTEALESNSIEFHETGEKIGFFACRIEACMDAAKDSVNFWTRETKSFPYGKPDEAIKDLAHRQLAQLMDTGSQYMGWGAAMAEAGVVYAVALFNNIGSTDMENLKRLKPPIIGVCVNFF